MMDPLGNIRSPIHITPIFTQIFKIYKYGIHNLKNALELLPGQLK
jgi:hypothetical protein